MTKVSNILTNKNTAFKVTDDEVAKTSVLIKANAGDVTDDKLAELAHFWAIAQKSAQLTDDQVLKLSKMIAGSKKVEEAVKVSDEEVAKVTEMFKKANAGATGKAKFTDDELAKIGMGFAHTQKRTSLSDEQVGKLAQLFAEMKQVASLSGPQIFKIAQNLAPVAQKDKKSWSTLKKVIVSVFGVTLGGAVIYATVKLATKDSASTTAATTTPSI